MTLVALCAFLVVSAINDVKAVAIGLLTDRDIKFVVGAPRFLQFLYRFPTCAKWLQLIWPLHIRMSNCLRKATDVEWILKAYRPQVCDIVHPHVGPNRNRVALTANGLTVDGRLRWFHHAVNGAGKLPYHATSQVTGDSVLTTYTHDAQALCHVGSLTQRVNGVMVATFPDCNETWIRYGNGQTHQVETDWLSTILARYQDSDKVNQFDVEKYVEAYLISKDVSKKRELQSLSITLLKFFGGAKTVGSIDYYWTNLEKPGLRDYETKEQPSVYSLGYTPIGRPCAPYLCESTDMGAVELRLNRIRNRKTPEGFDKYAREFVAKVVSSSWLPYLEPHSYEYVQGKLNKPHQRHRIERVVTTLRDVACVVNAFVKAEAYAEPKDPRNISAVDMSSVLKLSRYTYRAKEEVFSKMHWYMPCKTPVEIATTLHTFCNKHKVVAETDFSRFDGTISEWLRENVEVAVYARLFPHHPEVAELVRREFHAKCYTRTGIRYDPQGSRLSGSPLTTDGNTLIAGFVDYCALRGSMGVDMAWDNIGLHFGDDGVSRNIGDMERVARQLGLSLKLEAKEFNVGFLGRIFPDPQRSTTSFQDPRRVWPKITVVSSNHDMLARFRSKCAAYVISDPNTPLLSTYCKKVCELVPEGKMYHDEMGYLFQLWPDTTWPYDELDSDAAECAISEMTSVPIHTLREMDRYFSNASQLQQVLDPPFRTILSHSSTGLLRVDGCNLTASLSTPLIASSSTISERLESASVANEQATSVSSKTHPAGHSGTNGQTRPRATRARQPAHRGKGREMELDDLPPV